METLIRCPDQIWVCTVCQLPSYGSPDYNGLIIWNKYHCVMDISHLYNIYFCVEVMVCIVHGTDNYHKNNTSPRLGIHNIATYTDAKVSLHFALKQMQTLEICTFLHFFCCNYFQITLEGNDLGNPNQPSSNEAVVTVFVDRNQFPPEFLSSPYSGFVQRDHQNNRWVTDVTTRDNDTVVSWIKPLTLLFRVFTVC